MGPPSENEGADNKAYSSGEKPRMVFEQEYPQYKLVFMERSGGLELAGTIEPKGPSEFGESTVLGIFREMNFKGNLNVSNLREFCMRGSLGERVENLLLVRGVEPQKGRDETLDFKVKPSTSKPTFVKGKHGQIDYHDLHLFENVAKDQVVALLLPPEKGRPGVTVTGEALPAEDGRMMSSPPRAGKHVKVEPDAELGGKKFTAMMEGRVLYENGEISVSDSFVVDGNVDFSVGHINFVGSVEVKGDILNDFNVKAGKSLAVEGNVGVSVVECGGDITLGGMSGDGKGFIRCGGSLAARYLSGVEVECDGDVVVENGVVNCVIKSGGQVRVSGKIMGGETMALRGIEADTIGSDVGVRTKITSGACFRALERIRKIHEELDPLTTSLEKISERLDPLLKNPRAMLGLNQRDKETFRQLALDYNEGVKKQKVLKDELDAIREDIDRRGNAIVNANRSIEKGVEITLGPLKEHVESRIFRPVTVVKHSRKNHFRYLSKHELTQNVKELEQRLLKEEEEEAARMERRKQGLE